jgi:hypothetical protein
MKRISTLILLTLLAAVLGTTAAVAGEHGEAHHNMMDLSAYLNLTADQKVTWEAAHSDFQAAAAPLHQKSREARTNLETVLRAQSDACTVGSAFLAVRAVEDQMAAAHDALKARVESVLTTDQKSKLEALHAAESAREPHMIRERSE